MLKSSSRGFGTVAGASIESQQRLSTSVSNRDTMPSAGRRPATSSKTTLKRPQLIDALVGSEVDVYGNAAETFVRPGEVPPTEGAASSRPT